MAMTEGTDWGFVIAAPSSDPGGTQNNYMDTRATTNKSTSPAGATTITEVGWWCDTATQEANFEVGIYDATGATVPGEAGELLEVERTNAKGTTAGWKVVTGLNWTISSSTIYWLAFQLDDTTTATYASEAWAGGNGRDKENTKTTLDDPFGGGALFTATGMIGIYALYEGAAGTNMTVQVDEAYKDVATAYVQVDEAWKEVASAVVNVDDAWDTIF